MIFVLQHKLHYLEMKFNEEALMNRMEKFNQGH